MNQIIALKRLEGVVPEAIDEASQRIRVSPQELLDLYGDSSMVCNDIIAILPLLSQEEREKVKEGIYEKQKAFWNAPEQVEYYTKIHPQLPPVPGHFERLVEEISPQDHGTVVDLGCGCGALMKALLEENESVRIIGIDYAPNVLAMVPQLVPHLGDGQVKLINHDLRKGIPLPDESQTKVVSNWGIVYLLPDDLQAVLHEVCRILKPGGRFICSSATITGERLALGVFLRSAPKKLHFLWEVIKKPRVIQAAQRFGADLRRFFPVHSPEELEEMMEEAGLRVVSKELTLMGKSVTIVAVASKDESKGGCL